MKIEFLASAQNDIEEILLYIKKEDRNAALEILTIFELSISQLEQNSLLGCVPKRIPQLEKLGWRFLDVKGYLVFYSIEIDKILIRNIVYGWMTWNKWKNKATKLNLSPKPELLHKELFDSLKKILNT